jgi:NitT/TauT family transport system substrate-binding protein
LLQKGLIMNPNTLLFICLSIFSCLSSAAEKNLIRLGVLASGTLNWELAALQNEGFLPNNSFSLETVSLANPQAGKVALQSGGVDMIVSDWIWVSSTRSQGSDYTFYPYSTSAGGLMVPADSKIGKLSDLQGKKLGIAGGELDKNWSLLQALGLKEGLDLNHSVEKIYGAPPLLNRQLLDHKLDALLTYWQFAAELEVKGYKQLMNGEDIIRTLGIAETVPSLGYVFKASWAAEHKEAVQAFFKNAQAAKDRLCISDQAWEKMRQSTGANTGQAPKQIRNRYCEGRVKNWSAREQNAAAVIYRTLHQLGDNKLTGKVQELQPGTFWSAD